MKKRIFTIDGARLRNGVSVFACFRTLLCTLILVACVSEIPSQSGDFNIKKSVIASGGIFAGESFVLQSAIGQPVSGNVSGGQFAIAGGLSSLLFSRLRPRRNIRTCDDTGRLRDRQRDRTDD